MLPPWGGEREASHLGTGGPRARRPAGPFLDSSAAPFICQRELGGSIDASVVRDSYCCGREVALWSQRLAADGRTLIGQPASLLVRDRAWEGGLIEAPTMWQEGGRWRLLYSANLWCRGLQRPRRRKVGGLSRVDRGDGGLQQRRQ